jgi:phosphoenolpyruvate-protein kinase (PTS system EI component)
MLPFLLGIGLKKFSIDIINAPSVQRQINSISLNEAGGIAQTMLGFGRISEVEAYLEARKLGAPHEA